MDQCLYALHCLSGILFFYLVSRACLRGHGPEVDDQASLLPFADDPLVARRVEQAIGKPVPAVAPDSAFQA